MNKQFWAVEDTEDSRIWCGLDGQVEIFDTRHLARKRAKEYREDGDNCRVVEIFVYGRDMRE
jgi:hypothetical protein